MAFKEINSKQNHFIRYINSLKEKKRRDIEKSCIIEGEKILSDLASRELSIRMFFVSESGYKGARENAEKIARRSHFNFIIPDSLMNHISTTETGAGFMAVAETPNDSYFEITIESDGLYLILDNIQDPGNCGTIFRSASAFNINGIFLYGNCTDPYSPKTIRASSGQTLLLNHYKINDIDGLLELKKQGLTFYGMSGDGESELSNLIFSTPSAFILGNEGKGISQELKKIADKKIRISISENIESLNVSVTASILCWELYKR